jgi:hypothetical protein
VSLRSTPQVAVFLDFFIRGNDGRFRVNDNSVLDSKCASKSKIGKPLIAVCELSLLAKKSIISVPNPRARHSDRKNSTCTVNLEFLIA